MPPELNRTTPPAHCVNCALRVKMAFSPKTPQELAQTQKLRQRILKLPAGAELIRVKDDDADLYTLYSGWAFRHRSLPDGRRQILNFFLPGDLIGFQLSMLSAADHNVEALTDIELCVFTRGKVWTIFQNMPELAFQLSWLGAREEHMVDDNLTAVGQLSAAERVSSLIVGLYRRAQALGFVEDQTFEFPLRREHIADALGLSLVHTIKTWSALRKAGLFEQRGGRLRLSNPKISERLAAIVDREWTPRPLL